MHDGVAAKEIYGEMLSYIQKHKPELVKHLPKNIGFGVG
jgi:nucleosome binding factor SPN SPT16 subunit